MSLRNWLSRASLLPVRRLTTRAHAHASTAPCLHGLGPNHTHVYVALAERRCFSQHTDSHHSRVVAPTSSSFSGIYSFLYSARRRAQELAFSGKHWMPRGGPAVTRDPTVSQPESRSSAVPFDESAPEYFCFNCNENVFSGQFQYFHPSGWPTFSRPARNGAVLIAPCEWSFLSSFFFCILCSFVFSASVSFLLYPPFLN